MSMNIIILILCAAIPSYLLGSLNGAIITSQVFYRKDIRKYGSGNPGLTNFFRVFGKGGVLLVIVIDVVKTATPVIFSGWLFATFTDMPISEAWLLRSLFNISLFGVLISGFSVMLGHCFPIFYGFRGGKGVMASGTIVVIVDWRLALICWSIFFIILLTTRYVSLGSITACFTTPFLQYFIFGLGGIREFIVALLCGMLVVIRHEANIKRLIKGEESKQSFGKKKDS